MVIQSFLLAVLKPQIDPCLPVVVFYSFVTGIEIISSAMLTSLIHVFKIKRIGNKRNVLLLEAV